MRYFRGEKGGKITFRWLSLIGSGHFFRRELRRNDDDDELMESLLISLSELDGKGRVGFATDLSALIILDAFGGFPLVGALRLEEEEVAPFPSRAAGIVGVGGPPRPLRRPVDVLGSSTRWSRDISTCVLEKGGWKRDERVERLPLVNGSGAWFSASSKLMATCARARSTTIGRLACEDPGEDVERVGPLEDGGVCSSTTSSTPFSSTSPRPETA